MSEIQQQFVPASRLREVLGIDSYTLGCLIREGLPHFNLTPPSDSGASSPQPWSDDYKPVFEVRAVVSWLSAHKMRGEWPADDPPSNPQSATLPRDPGRRTP